jgi:hypothetical protein
MLSYGPRGVSRETLQPAGDDKEVVLYDKRQ